jgi:hypothetical protein
MSFGAKKFTIKAQLFLLLPIILVYLTLMTRSSGVDVVNYIYAYNEDPTFITDFLFQEYYKFLKLLKFPFFISTLLIGIVNSLSLLYFTSKNFPRYIFITFVFFFLHLMVIRDFAQFRISFAFSLFLLGLLKKTKFRFLFLICSIGIHKSIFVLILAYYFTKLFVKQSNSTKLVFLVGAIILSILLYEGIQYILFIDPRIEIYLSWDKEGYGQPVTTYGSLLFQLFILSVFFLFFGIKEFTSDFYVMLTFFGIIIFIILSPTAIFAFRLSNLLWSFYPFIIIQIIEKCRIRYYESFYYLISIPIILLVVIFLVSRHGTFRIIDSIQL